MKAVHLYPDPGGLVVEIQGTDDPMMALLYYAPSSFTDGTSPAGHVRFRHTCVTIPDDYEGSITKITAPLLSQHLLRLDDGKITVSPSILCPDCGLHGFVRRDRWDAS
jgi:hypothetical protein